ncbi:MAG TPA: hypothetical protein VIM83_06635, partial [Candidatus Limnocylindria bacterium]
PYTLKQNGSPVAIAENDGVVYSSGGGDPIGGLVDGQTYYAHIDGGAIQLMDKKSTDGGTVIPLTSNGSGRSHSIVLSGMQPSGDASAYGPRTISAGSTTGFRGVGVTATNSDDIAAVGISAGIAGSVAVNLAGSIDVSTINTSASIGSSALVNCADATCAANVSGANAAQSVRVAAANQFNELGIAGSVAVGLDAGVAVPVGVRIIHLNSDAFINDSAKVNARGDISVTSTAKDAIISVVAGAGGGIVGVAGSVGVTLVTLHTFASTGTSVQANADGDVLVAASDDTRLLLVQIGLAGGFVGVGAAIGVAKLDKDTEAFIGSYNTINGKGNGTGLIGIHNGDYKGRGFDVFHDGFGTPTEFHGVAVQASSSEDIFGLSASVGGGFVGVAGGVAVTLISLTTKALVGSYTTVNGDASGTSSLQTVDIAAVDAAKTLTIAGGIGGGFVGVAGGVDIGTLDQTVQSAIGIGATVSARSDVDLFALSRKDVQTYAVSIGGGFVGVAGSVSVWSVGEQSTTTYQDDGGGQSKGAWTSGTKYGKGDVVTVGTDKYYATQTTTLVTSSPASNTTDWAPVETKQPMQSNDGTHGDHSAVGDSDSVAKGGDGGYTSGLNGTQAKDAGPWHSGAYDPGVVVTYNGAKYIKRETTADATLDPEHNSADWDKQSASADKTSSKLSSGLSTAGTRISA